MVPGWGQVNNGKWWKVPLVYGALGVSGYYIQTEGRLYKGYRDGYVALTDEDPTTVYETAFDAQEVLDRRDFHRTNLEQSVLTFVLFGVPKSWMPMSTPTCLGFDVSEDLGWTPDWVRSMGCIRPSPCAPHPCFPPSMSQNPFAC